jgi:hypothetical protein
MALPPKSYLDLFHSLSADLKGLKLELSKMRLAQQEANLGCLNALQAEQLRHASTRQELEAQIIQLNLENTLISMQGESTASTLRSEITALKNRYDQELVALMAILKLRIYDVQRQSYDRNDESADMSTDSIHELSRIETAISTLKTKIHSPEQRPRLSQTRIEKPGRFDSLSKDEL